MADGGIMARPWAFITIKSRQVQILSLPIKGMAYNVLREQNKREVDISRSGR